MSACVCVSALFSLIPISIAYEKYIEFAWYGTYFHVSVYVQRIYVCVVGEHNMNNSPQDKGRYNNKIHSGDYISFIPFNSIHNERVIIKSLLNSIPFYTRLRISLSFLPIHFPCFSFSFSFSFLLNKNHFTLN